MMRFIIPVAAAALLALPAAAQTTTTTPAPAPSTEAPAPATTPAPAPMPAPATTAKPMTHAHKTLDDRFKEANTSGDGKLTKDQATAAKWRDVSRHFDAMDKDHKGYVTVDDIKAYHASGHKHATTPKKPTTNS